MRIKRLILNHHHYLILIKISFYVSDLNHFCAAHDDACDYAHDDHDGDGGDYDIYDA